MKFEIKVYEMETVNTFVFDIENTSSLDDFLYDYVRETINSHAYNADYDCKQENVLIGLADDMEKPLMEYPDYTYFKSNYGFYFSDFINFLADFYKDSEEIDIEVRPLESKYYGVYVDETFSDDEAQHPILMIYFKLTKLSAIVFNALEACPGPVPSMKE